MCYQVQVAHGEVQRPSQCWQRKNKVSTGNTGCGVRMGGRGEWLSPGYLPLGFWWQEAEMGLDTWLSVIHRTRGAVSNDAQGLSVCLPEGNNKLGFWYYPAPDVIQPWDFVPRTFLSLHGVVLLVLSPCWACKAQRNIAVWIQTCLDSKCSQQYLKLGGAWLVGGSWVINPPLSSWLNSTAVHQKPNFKVWGRTVLVRAIPLSALGNAFWVIFFSLSCTFWKYIYCLYLLRAYKRFCCC